jgi:hypothetical protein
VAFVDPKLAFRMTRRVFVLLLLAVVVEESPFVKARGTKGWACLETWVWVKK